MNETEPELSEIDPASGAAVVAADLACAACGSPVLAEDRFCENCGVNLTGEVPAEVEAEAAAGEGTDAAAASSATVTCPDCGGSAFSDGYCDNCGRLAPDPRDHIELSLGRVAGVTDRGLRHSRNEDAMALAVVGAPDDPRPTSIIVACDGVSTSRDPHIASLVAAELIRDHLAAAMGRGESAQSAMTSAIEGAQLAVAGLAEDPADPGNSSCATVVAAVVEPGLVTVGSVGDSRVYWLAPDPAESRRLTEDDSWAGLMIAQGILGEEEAYRAPQAHTIIRWLGADAPDEPPHIVQFAPDGPGLVLACSDGLWNYVPEASRLAELVVPTGAGAGAWGGLQAAANSLCAVALESGGHDNITVTLAAYPPVPAEAGQAGRPEESAATSRLAETVQLPQSQAEHGQESTVEGSAL